MQTRQFTPNGPLVSVVGFGAGHIGSPDLSEDAAGRLLNQVVDAGITLIDTARGYGLSEERIGRHLAHRRKDFVLSTKVGYGIPGHQDWTYDGIVAGVDAALRLLRTDRLDVVYLHSCPLATLQQGDVIRALHRCREQGMLTLAGYSGENEELDWAVASGAFDALQCSVNLADQGSLAQVLPTAAARGLGVIAKRPLANAPWRFAERPVGNYAETYWLRLKEMGLDTLIAHNGGWASVALRFTAFTPGVSTCIVGSSGFSHLRESLDAAALGPLPALVYQQLRDAFEGHGQDWRGEV
jgi:aryl-alcohol dehydrogenase-like predicted oxidoreductase